MSNTNNTSNIFSVETLPILKFKNEILNSTSNYIIVEAETGSGKSTQVPVWYYELGQKVLVTEPLIETVIGTSEFVAQTMGCKLGGVVGYRTGQGRSDSPSTDILFCTDGLALVRELAHHNRFDILVIDELHEWNTNQSTLEAWAWKHLQSGDSMFKKIIVLSATLNSEELSRKRGNPPIFKVPGRQFPIVDRAPGRSLEDDVQILVKEGFDVLVFQPGKAEIAKTIETLRGIGAELIPFHGEIERTEKNRAYQSYDRPKVIVSTNALETGRTLVPSPGRQLAVVDSGMERRVELRDGIEVLALAPIALARGKQRRGRTGRVGEGVYIDHCPSSSRVDFPVPEILRTRLDQTVLRLAVAGYDATELPFFHQLDERLIKDAKRALQALGAMDEKCTVTEIGKLMARLPVSVQYSRMIIEAQKRGVVDDVVTIASILEVGGLRDRTEKWRYFAKSETSDLLAELSLWNVAKGKRGDELRECGIFGQSFWRAKELRSKLTDALYGYGINFKSSGNQEDILKSYVSGMVDHLFNRQYGGVYKNGGSTERQLGKESVVKSNPEWIVGMPKDIEFKNKRGYTQTLNLVTMASVVDPMWLADVAPQLVKVETGLNPRFDSGKDCVVSTTNIFFNGQLIKEDVVLDVDNPKAVEAFLSSLLKTGSDICRKVTNAKQEIQKQVETLHVRSGGVIPNNASEQIQEFYMNLCTSRGIKSVKQLLEYEDIYLSLDAIVAPELRAQVETQNPSEIEINGNVSKIEYLKEYSEFYGKITLEYQTLKGMESMPSLPGKKVKLVCSHAGYTFTYDNLADMKLNIIRKMYEKAWSVARSEHEHDSWISNPTEVYPFLSKLLSEIEVVKDEDGNPVFGFFSLHSDSDPDFKIKIRESKEEAEKETSIGLTRLLKKSLKSVLVVPSEEPFKTYKESYWSNSWELTEAGKALQNRFETLVEEVQVNASNFSETLTSVKEKAEDAKLELGGKFVSMKSEITSLEVNFDAQVNELKDEQKELVANKIQEIRNLIEAGKSSLKATNYDEVSENINKANSLMSELPKLLASKMEVRNQAELARNSVDGALTDIYHRQNNFALASSKAEQKAGEFINGIFYAFRQHDYSLVESLVTEAKSFIEETHLEISFKKDFEAKFEQHIQKYSSFDFLNASGSIISDMFYTMDRDHRYFAALANSIEDSGCIEVLQSLLGGQKIASLNATLDGRHSIDLVIRVEEGSYLLPIDWSKVIILQSWQPPSGEKLELISQLRQLEQRHDKFLSEYNRMQDSYGTRAELSFELDPSRGTLFCIASVTDFSVSDSRTGNYITFSGSVRFFCDPKRSSANPEPGESWICTWGKMIGRDNKGRPIIVANPQARVENLQLLQAEIVRLKAEISGNVFTPAVSDSPETEESSSEGWVDLGKGWWRCPNNHSNKYKKSLVICSDCGAKK